MSAHIYREYAEENMRRLLLRVVGMAHNTLDNYIVPGLTSSLVGGGPDGAKVRLFQHTRDADDFVTPHSHRFRRQRRITRPGGPLVVLAIPPLVDPLIWGACNPGRTLA